MNGLERKKCEVRLKQVDAAIAELELKIEERKEDIKRMEDHIELQRKIEKEIKEQLKS